eukprot:1457521-Pyramimonas_sp.AAC.1
MCREIRSQHLVQGDARPVSIQCSSEPCVSTSTQEGTEEGERPVEASEACTSSSSTRASPESGSAACRGQAWINTPISPDMAKEVASIQVSDARVRPSIL